MIGEEELVQTLKEIYSTNAKAQRTTIEKYYLTTSTFNDPIIKTSRKQEMIKQFNIMSTLFQDIQIEPVNITYNLEKDMVYVESIVEFRVYSFLPVIKLRMISILSMVNSQVISHEDVWSVKDLTLSSGVLVWFYDLFRNWFPVLTSFAYDVLYGVSCAFKKEMAGLRKIK